MIVMIDNYDSFTYNLVQYVGELGERVHVVRNDEVSLDEIAALSPKALMISPGPQTPDEAGISLDCVRQFAGSIPILGVCLGHQTLARAFGGSIIRAKRLMHGKTSQIFHDGNTIFRGLPQPFTATRYHSLIVDSDTLPDCFEVSAKSEYGEMMAIRHRSLPLEGVQFHPESILTTHGQQLLQNFLDIYCSQKHTASV